ncbi:hypothetical protein [Mycolicibacterium hippocampi]|uniref:hypothetical protein n=1 Tax=Mycolicibacterium hippocampi TaxID=659824 RepID=UPI0013D7BC4D|nr:hypothetical protein [Mycolicibacterium hippocampi]
MSIDPDMLAAMRELKNDPAQRHRWNLFINSHPELAELAEPKRRRQSLPRQLKPGQCWDDRKRWYRNRGIHGDGALAAEDNRGGHPSSVAGSDTYDSADRDRSVQMESGSLLDLHAETGGAYGFEDYSDPDHLEVCRECGTRLNLARDHEGFVQRSIGGQAEYCSARCQLDGKNSRRRYRRARASGRRVLSTYSAAYGVPCGQVSTGPQARLPTGAVVPWTVPCWAADPWLKFWRAGSVPLGRGPDTDYGDSTGNIAARAVDHPELRDRLLVGTGLGIPISKSDAAPQPYHHNVFDGVFDGMKLYRTHVLAGRPD